MWPGDDAAVATRRQPPRRALSRRRRQLKREDARLEVLLTWDGLLPEAANPRQASQEQSRLPVAHGGGFLFFSSEALFRARLKA